MTGSTHLSGAQSEANLSINPKLSDARKAKLIDIKKREDLKDALTEKFKNRFGHGSTSKEADEVSVASAAIRNEVDQFSKTACMSQGNLNRLERRLQQRALGKVSDDRSAVSAVSAYTALTGLSQRSRSAASLVGKSVVSGVSATCLDWSKLDEYASYLHEQDAVRQKVGVQALQRKLKMDLDQQVNEKLRKREAVLEEDRRYHQNSLLELERWKEQEQDRAEEHKAKILKQKQDRDEQLNYERMLKEEEAQRKTRDESQLVERIVTEMEAEQKRFEKKKEDTKKTMRKVFEENAEDQRRRDQAKQEAMQKEAAAMKEFNRILDEQEEQRAQELATRMERQSQLMKKLQANVEGSKKQAGDSDAKRAAAQQEESDRHFYEAEAVKQARLRQMRLENQAYLIKQMEEKDGRKYEDDYLQSVQAQILARDSQEYTEMEKKKTLDRQSRNIAHRKEIERQIEVKQSQPVQVMSEAEVKFNKPLLQLVHQTLKARDMNLHQPL